MATWIFAASPEHGYDPAADPPQIVLKTVIAEGRFTSSTDAQIAAILNAETAPDLQPLDVTSIRSRAIQERVWGKLEVWARRTIANNSPAADKDKSYAAANFMAMLSLLGSTPFVRGNAMWNAMDADLTVLVSAAGGDAVLSGAQATWMRAQGDRLVPKWEPAVEVEYVGVARSL